MTKPHSMDIRERAMARLDAGETVRKIAETLSVAPSSVVKWSERRRAYAEQDPGRAGRLVARPDADGAFTLRGLVAELAERGLKWITARFGPSPMPRGLDETSAKTNIAPLRG